MLQQDSGEGSHRESVSVERLDHVGVMSAVIKDIGLLEMIEARLIPDEPAVSTPGEAVAGMILHGLGLAPRPVAVTPPFCASQPRDLVCRGGLRAELFNRFQRGRTLAEVYA